MSPQQDPFTTVGKNVKTGKNWENYYQGINDL